MKLPDTKLSCRILMNTRTELIKVKTQGLVTSVRRANQFYFLFFKKRKKLAYALAINFWAPSLKTLKYDPKKP